MLSGNDFNTHNGEDAIYMTGGERGQWQINSTLYYFRSIRFTSLSGLLLKPIFAKVHWSWHRMAIPGSLWTRSVNLHTALDIDQAGRPVLKSSCMGGGLGHYHEVSMGSQRTQNPGMLCGSIMAGNEWRSHTNVSGADLLTTDSSRCTNDLLRLLPSNAVNEVHVLKYMC